MAPWKELLDLISGPESGGNYNAVFGDGKNKIPLSQWTVDDLLAKKHLHLAKRGQSAAGRYQIINKTLKGLKKEMGLTGKEYFTPELQDQMGLQLLKRRGYDKFMAGQMSFKDFGNQLAMEWASFPVLSNINGKTRGQSYYAGDGLNSSHIKPETVEATLWKLRPWSMGQEPPPEKPVEPEPKEHWLVWLLRQLIALFRK
jgi:hypothetical protein